MFCMYSARKKNIASIPKDTMNATRFAPRNDFDWKKRKSTIGSAPRGLAATKGNGGGGGRGERGRGEQRDDRRRAPAPRVALDEGEHERPEADGDRQDAGDVDLVRRGLVARLARGGDGHEHRHYGHGDVEEEDRLPGDVLDEEAADDGADREGHGADAGPRADRLAALLRREGVGDDRQRRGHHERGADALGGAAGDEPGAALREADEGARQAEGDDAEEEHLAAAEDVA